MFKKINFLFFCLAVLLILILYLVLTSASVKEFGRTGRPFKNDQSLLSDESYRTKVKTIFTAYQTSASANNLTVEKLEDFKAELLSLKGFQAKFKRLHLDLILAIEGMESYLSQKDQREKNNSQQIIDQLKADYSWLN